MILQCKIHVQDLAEYRQAKKERDIIHPELEDDTNVAVPCFWEDIAVDMLLCTEIQAQINREGEDESCYESEGMTLLYLADGRSIVTNVPFFTMMDVFVHKNDVSLVMYFHEKRNEWMIAKADDIEFEAE